MSRGSNGHGLVERVRLSVVISTYEWPEALDVVLRALSAQSDPDFDVVVADDGSGSETAALVSSWREHFGERLTHSWHADEGFRVARARNLAALTSRSDMLAFLDGDCVPRRDFVRGIRASARPGWFAVGRRFFLSSELSRRVFAQQLAIHRWSTARWLFERRHWTGIGVLTVRDRRTVGRLGVPEYVPHNNAYTPVAVVAKDFRRVNGYDMRYEGWGEEDGDLAIRLSRIGLRCGHTGASGTVLHLWHPSRMDPERPNWWLLQETERSASLAAVTGLRELEHELELERSGIAGQVELERR